MSYFFKNPFKCLVNFQQGQKLIISGSIENPWAKKVSLNRVQKILLFQDSETLPKMAKRKKKEVISLRAGSNLVRPSVQVEFNTHFCPASFEIPPNWWLPSQVLKTQNKTDKKIMAASGKERISNQWIWIWIWKWRDKFYLPLYWVLQTEILESWLW